MLLLQNTSFLRPSFFESKPVFCLLPHQGVVSKKNGDVEKTYILMHCVKHKQTFFFLIFCAGLCVNPNNNNNSNTHEGNKLLFFRLYVVAPHAISHQNQLNTSTVVVGRNGERWLGERREKEKQLTFLLYFFFKQEGGIFPSKFSSFFFCLILRSSVRFFKVKLFPLAWEARETTVMVELSYKVTFIFSL